MLVFYFCGRSNSIVIKSLQPNPTLFLFHSCAKIIQQKIHRTLIQVFLFVTSTGVVSSKVLTIRNSQGMPQCFLSCSIEHQEFALVARLLNEPCQTLYASSAIAGSGDPTHVLEVVKSFVRIDSSNVDHYHKQFLKQGRAL